MSEYRQGGTSPGRGEPWGVGRPLPPPAGAPSDEPATKQRPADSGPGGEASPFGSAPAESGRDPFRRRAREGMEHVTWSLRATIVGASIVLVPLLLLLLGTAAEGDSADTPDPTVAEAVVSQVMLSIFMGGVALAAAWLGSHATRRPHLWAALGFRRFRPSAIAWLALAYLAYFVASIAIFLLLEPEQEDVTQFLGAEDGTLGTVVAGTMIIGLAPVVEELLFRGFFHGGLRRTLSFVPAALITSALFGLIHFTGPGSIGIVPQLALFAFALAWLYEKTGSLWPPIALHALNNAFAFAILVTDVDEELSEPAVRALSALPL